MEVGCKSSAFVRFVNRRKGFCVFALRLKLQKIRPSPARADQSLAATSNLCRSSVVVGHVGNVELQRAGAASGTSTTIAISAYVIRSVWNNSNVEAGRASLRSELLFSSLNEKKRGDLKIETFRLELKCIFLHALKRFLRPSIVHARMVHNA